MPEPAQTRREQAFDLSRSNALSDGVFAIALTLLVLHVDVPQNVGDDLWGALRDTLPNIESYVISFAVIALLWVRHHRFFGQLEAIDQPLLALNLAYLGFVAFLPFCSEMLGDHGNEPAAAIVFAVSIALVATFGALMHAYAVRHDLLSRTAPEMGPRRHWVWPAVFLLTIPLALVHPTLAEVTWVAVLVLGVARRTWDHAVR